MPIEPEFMRHLSRFREDRDRVRTVEEWRAFNARWFDVGKWPKKTHAQLKEEADHKRGPIDLGGRRWSYTTWVYDLTPAARYQYFAARQEVGLPLLFPEPRPKEGAPRDEGWSQSCPFDEITTAELGAEICPKCGRPLLYVRSAE
jgi:hypothetical protein